MKRRSKVELFERIRRDSRLEGLSIRGLARRHGVHRRLVREALASAVPAERKTPQRTPTALTAAHRATVRGWLVEDRAAPPKQRHTARRVWQRLVDEHDAQVAESTVRGFVAEVRRELSGGTGLVMVPQTHPPAEEAEVDFGEFKAWVAGALVRLWMFVLRLSHSGKAVHVAYANETQESFFDGFVTAFDTLGGVPGRVRCDNLKPAVIRVLLGRARLENERFVVLRSHYGFDAFYCQPGPEGAHEKGGVEGEVGRFRRRHLTPLPAVASLAELNALLAAADADDDARRIAARAETVGQAAARELPLLSPLPVDRLDISAQLSCRVDPKSRVCVRQSYYSVPVRLAGRKVTVRLGAREVRVLDGARVVATHVRSLHKGTEDLVLDHYLEVLARKPGALPGATALAQARTTGAFTGLHQRYWDLARRRLGDAAGTRALIAVLLLHRTLPAAAVTAGITAALAGDRIDADLVAVEARRHLERTRQPTNATATAATATTAGTAGTALAPVEVLGGARPPGGVRAGGGEDPRPAPSLAGYDELLAAGGAR
jgi:transposase